MVALMCWRGIDVLAVACGDQRGAFARSLAYHRLAVAGGGRAGFLGLGGRHWKVAAPEH